MGGGGLWGTLDRKENVVWRRNFFFKCLEFSQMEVYENSISVFFLGVFDGTKVISQNQIFSFLFKIIRFRPFSFKNM